MKESFEKKPRHVEVETAPYAVEADFSPADIKKELKKLENKNRNVKEDYNKIEWFTLFYIVSNNNFKIHLALHRHPSAELSGMDWSEDTGGTIQVNTELKIADIDADTGSLKSTPANKFPQIKKAVQGYLDGIKK